MNPPDPEGPVLSTASAAALEMPQLAAVLAELASCDLGRELALGLTPFDDPGRLDERRARYAEAERLIAAQPLVPALGVAVGELLERLETDRPPLTGADVVALAAIVRAVGDAQQRILTADPACPTLAEWAEPLPDLGDFARDAAAKLDARGEVRDDASPQLVRLRSRIRSTRDRIYGELGDFVSSHADHLSEDTIPMRGGRLVVMLQSGAHGKLHGLTHGRSGSRQSFYFEPLAVVESNNTLQQAVDDEAEERARILRQLLTAARQALPELQELTAFLAELDLLQAAAGFARRTEANLPELAPAGELELIAARHPLLDPRLADLRARGLGASGHEGEVVPLDAALSAERRALVVTGPNAGGKTVALKTIGLLTALAQCGLPVPAAPGSRLPFVRRIVATVGDDQDLLADRSTFSGRLLRLASAWDAAGPDSLVLVDELGSGTDPAEGAALAVALLEGLVACDSLAVITTHLAEVASAALELDGADCAAMAFDPESHEPTFRLVPGPPGSSEALALARRLGLPAAWLDRAEELLGSEHRDLRRLIAEVEETRDRLAAELAAAERETEDAATLRRRLETQAAALTVEKKSLAKRLRSELDEFRRETLERFRDESDRLRKELQAGMRKGGARKTLAAEATERLFAGAPELPDPAPDDEGELRVGGPVRHRSLGWEGVLEKLERGRAEVSVRGKRVRCKEGDLVGLAGEAKPARAGKASRTAPSGAGRRRSRAPESSDVTPELMLIGKRVEPALEELDSYLDRALLASRAAVRVVHGHGTGRLKKAVREHLRRHPAAASYRPGEDGEGGDGATVVTLRG